MSTHNPMPVIFGCARHKLLPEERRFFKEANPFGVILFSRNCQDVDQVQGLIAELRHAVGRDDLAILIDNEGGRVTRLNPPAWPKHPPARILGEIYEKNPEWGIEAMQINARIMANELVTLGINVNCAPVIDLFVQGASPAIGDRAFSKKPAAVTALARCQAETFLDNGILPVIKHFPGYGRVREDPHEALPAISATEKELMGDDFLPFMQLKDLPIGMTAHALFTNLDPKVPASISPRIHKDIFRGALGFEGLLLSDDICMKALQGMPEQRAQSVLAAGTDIVLHCNGNLAEMRMIASAVPPITKAAEERWQRAKSRVKKPSKTYSPLQDNDRLDVLLGGLAYDEDGA